MRRCAAARRGCFAVEGKGRRIEARGENRRESNKLGKTKCAEDVIKVSGVSALLAAGRQRRR